MFLIYEGVQCQRYLIIKVEMMKNVTLMIGFLLLLSCAAGTLGGFESVNIGLSKRQLNIVIDSFYKIYQAYSEPQKWKVFDSWSERGYDFLRGRVFYFATEPEEMYYASILGSGAEPADSGQSLMAVRAVCSGSDKWFLNKDLDEKNIARVEKRFKEEIVEKLNAISHGVK